MLSIAGKLVRYHIPAAKMGCWSPVYDWIVITWCFLNGNFTIARLVEILKMEL